ncbi:hypothetical protein GCM10009814_02790 [Lapillicoccus jejuensis]
MGARDDPGGGVLPDERDEPPLTRRGAVASHSADSEHETDQPVLELGGGQLQEVQVAVPQGER